MMANELGGPLRMAALVAEARRLASTDTLTGLLNRRAFVERIEKARAASDKQLFPISMLLLDVDHFKKVNDTLGHDAGDAVLQGVARVLLSASRARATSSRAGAARSSSCASRSTAEAGARIAAERVRRAIADAQVRAPERHRAPRDGLGRPRERRERRLGHPRSARPCRQGDVLREASRKEPRGDCMTTTRARFGRAALGAAMIAFTTLASTAHAEPSPNADAASPPAAAPASATATPAPDASVTTEPPATKSGRTAWPWVIMGGGVALIVTATVLELHSVKEDDRREADETKLFSLPQGDPARAELQKSAASHDDSAKSARTGALIIGTVGFLAVAGSVVLWFVEGGSSSGAAAVCEEEALALAVVRPRLRGREPRRVVLSRAGSTTTC